MISKDLKNTQMYKALVEFDKEFGKLNNKKPMSLNVIGGFALIVPGIRKGDYTDIDYAGKDFPDKVKELVDKIGMKYNLGRGFINNDCLVTGTTLEDMEYATGPLTFSHGFDLKYITVNILVPKAVKTNPGLINDIKNPDYDAVKDAVGKNGMLIRDLEKDFPNLINIALENNPFAG